MTAPKQTNAEPAQPTPVPPTPFPAKPDDRRGRWVAILTGALSILIGVVYLVLITVLDARGPMQPPPPEALGLAAAPSASLPNPVQNPVPVLSPAELVNQAPGGLRSQG
jgi:hypothetical protein